MTNDNIIYEDCLNKNQCQKGNIKCCYLVKNKCILKKIKEDD